MRLFTFPLLAIVVFGLGFQARAADEDLTRGWPKGIQAYQKPAGNCPANMPADANADALKLSKEYQAFIREQACRTNSLRVALEKEPAKLCPGMKPKDYLLCYEQSALGMASAGMLDLSSLKFLASAPLGYFLQDQEIAANAMESILQNMRLHWVNLRLIDHRSTPDQLKLPNKAELASLKKGDAVSAKTYAQSQLNEWEHLLQAAEKVQNTVRGRATVNGKNRLLIARQEFQKASDLWKKR